MPPPEEESLLGVFLICLEKLHERCALPSKFALLPHIAGTKSPFETLAYPFPVSSLEHFSSSAVKYGLFAIGTSADNHWHLSKRSVDLDDAAAFFEEHPYVLQYMRLSWWALRHQLAGINTCKEDSPDFRVFEGEGHFGYLSTPSDNWNVLHEAMDAMCEEAPEHKFQLYLKELSRLTVALGAEGSACPHKPTAGPMPMPRSIARVLRRRSELGISFKQHQLALTLLGSCDAQWRQLMFRHGAWEPPVHYIERLVGFLANVQHSAEGHYEARSIRESKQSSRHECSRERWDDEKHNGTTVVELMQSVVVPAVNAIHAYLHSRAKRSRRSIDLGLVKCDTSSERGHGTVWASPAVAAQDPALAKKSGKASKAVIK